MHSSMKNFFYAAFIAGVLKLYKVMDDFKNVQENKIRFRWKTNRRTTLEREAEQQNKKEWSKRSIVFKVDSFD